VIEAAAAGLGVALARRFQADDALTSGRLLRISPTQIWTPFACYLVWRPDSPRIAIIRRFADWLLGECGRAGLLNSE
jgi:LysR family glycine cleavage system transcriptional activator